MSTNENRKKKGAPRQDWKPNGIVKLLYMAWLAVFSAAKVALAAAGTVLLILVICGVVFVGVLAQYLQDEVLPNATTIMEDYALDQTSFLYYVDSHGEIQIQQMVYTTIDRRWASFDEIPKDLINAAVAIEDKRFYEHQGVDWITTVKACANMFFGGSSTFGGSTITQQLIKNTTKEDSITVQRKVLEIFRAQQLERMYDKNFVLERYLNTIFLGEGCYGVKSAAATYFGKELEMLTTAECASLIAITNNPSLYDPYLSPKNNRERQLIILGEMNALGMIDDAEYEEAKNQEMVFKSGIDEQDRLNTCPMEGCGYKDVLRNFIYVEEEGVYRCPKCGTRINAATSSSGDMYSWFTDQVLEDVARDMAAKNGLEWDDSVKEQYMEMIRRGGYHIFTTVDMDVQKVVDAVFEDKENLPQARSGQQLQFSIIVIDNRTGDIVGMSGGVGEKKDFDAYNRATDASLQTGSSIKPLTVYAPAFESGAVSPATVIDDLPLYYDGGGAFPLNFERYYTGRQTVYSGVRQSINAVAVNVLDLIGTGYSFNFAKNSLGLSSLLDETLLGDDYYLSDIGYAPLGLGALSYGVSVREMANAFATFANHGVFREARTYSKVYDSDGNLVLDNTQDTRQVFSEKTVDYMNYCMIAAAAYGTDYVANFSDIEVAGKTGTTSDNKDRWFCGLTGHYTAVVWCGYDTPEEINLVGDYRNPAARMWTRVMEPIHEGLGNIELYNRDRMYYVTVCLECGNLATDACGKDVRGIDRTASAKVYAEDIPSRYCTCHTEVDYCTTGGGVATEWCRKFAAAEADTGKKVTIEKRSLVKMTQERMEEFKAAKNYTLQNKYLQDNYIYLINRDGSDANFTGFDGNVNKNVKAPYLICPVHTEEAWKKFQAEQEATKPTETEPTTDPTAPTVPEGSTGAAE
ncbi:MAG: transglycosylase domain-containing protein [Firmicutes bacterium]|nr:transglycosylase domain-containing protein [Bacillota bacterium]